MKIDSIGSWLLTKIIVPLIIIFFIFLISCYNYKRWSCRNSCLRQGYSKSQYFAPNRNQSENCACEDEDEKSEDLKSK